MWMSEKDHEKFDRELLAGDPRTVSTGTKTLMAVMGIHAPPSVPMGRRPIPGEGGDS